MEQPGTPEYRYRRICHKLKNFAPEEIVERYPIYFFPGLNSEMRRTIRSKTGVDLDEQPLLFSCIADDKWCLLTMSRIIFQRETLSISSNIADIKGFIQTWGDLTDVDKAVHCHGNIKYSPWLRLVENSGRHFEVEIGNKFVFWDAIKYIKQINNTYPDRTENV